MPEKRVMKRVPAPAAAPTKKAVKRVIQPGPFDDDQTPVEVEANIKAGWMAAQEVIDANSPFAARLSLTTNTQYIKFLEDGPYASYAQHWLDGPSGARRPILCYKVLGRHCPLCEVGHKPSATTSFNIALLSDSGEGGAINKSWDVSKKVHDQIYAFAMDRKLGPLTRRTLYFRVSRTEKTQGQRFGGQQTLLSPIRESDLEEEEMVPLTDEDLAKLQAGVYTSDVVVIPPLSELQEAADELMTGDTPAGWSN